jgi:regulator of RNase E activity RraA
MDNLECYSSCDVADAMDKLGLKPGFLADLSMRSKGKVVGPAYTVKFVHKDSTLPKPNVHHVDAIPSGKGVVVVISAPGIAQNAVWGGLMSTRAQVLGAKGVVVDGRIRDLIEHEQLKFPVWSKGTSIMGAGRFTRVAAINEPIFVNGVTINPDDLIVADEDGVVVVSKNDVEKVVQACKVGVEEDKLCKQALKEGGSIKDTFAKYRTK